MNLKTLLVEIHESDTVFIQRMKELFLANTFHMTVAEKMEKFANCYDMMMTEGANKINAVKTANLFKASISEVGAKISPEFKKAIDNFDSSQYTDKVLSGYKKNPNATPTNITSATPVPFKRSKHSISNPDVNALPTRDYKHSIEVRMSDYLKKK